MITFKNVMPLKNYDSVSLAEQLRAHFAEFYPVRYSERLSDAIQVASYLHRSDVRRGNRGKMPNPPYIEHPLRVALRLATHFEVRNPDVLIAAVLHDTVEDHPYEFADFWGVYTVKRGDAKGAREYAMQYVSDVFGYDVASIVDDVSNPPFEGKRSKAEKIAAYQAHVEHIVKGSAYSLAVKFSDFVDNAGSLHHHYEYRDKDARYFVQRYSGLVPIYRAGLASALPSDWNVGAMRERLDGVEQEFDKFKATWTENDFCKTASLYGSTPDCPGLVVAQDSGVKCDTCRGWFCY